jgi:hypothetical protein
MKIRDQDFPRANDLTGGGFQVHVNIAECDFIMEIFPTAQDGAPPIDSARSITLKQQN